MTKSVSPDPEEAAAVLAKVLRAIHAGDLTAPSGAIARLEGAYLALRSLANGRAPSLEDLLGDVYLHDTDDYTMLMMSLDSLRRVSWPLRRLRLRRIGDNLVESFVKRYGAPSTREVPSYLLYGQAAGLALEAVAHFTESSVGQTTLESVERSYVERGRSLLSLAQSEQRDIEETTG